MKLLAKETITELTKQAVYYRIDCYKLQIRQLQNYILSL
jgi:hypothetical protein